MKKKIIISAITIIVFAVLAIYLLNRPQLLGNMKNSYTKQTTTTSDISFSGRSGDKASGTYTLVAECNDFIGKYSIKVYQCLTEK